MSILLFAGFFILYTSIFGKHLKPEVALVLTAPAPVVIEPPKPAPASLAPRPAAAKAVKPTVLVVKPEPAPLAAPTVANPEGDDAKPTKPVPLRKWATRHGIKGAGKMNLATLREAIEAAGL